MLDELGIRPSKRLGQNFLVSSKAVESIRQAVVAENPRRIVEIGAGLGAVTRAIASLASEMTAIELDKRLVDALQRTVSDLPAVKVWSGDVLDFDFADSASEGKSLVVGSIPYAITAPILQHVVAGREYLSGAVLVTQAEVAEKVAASPGPSGSALGVLVRAFADVEILRRIKRGAFYPVPDVDSALWRVRFLESPRFTAPPDRFFAVVRAAYGVRRKMLRGALRSLASKDAIARALEEAGVEGTVRGETLGFEAFDRLACALQVDET